MFISNLYDFTQWFNARCPGAYRQVTSQDIRDLVACGLIHRYGHYSREEDGKTILAILQYEQMREHRLNNKDEDKSLTVCLTVCKRCRKTFNPNPEGKPGRPPEYCTDCETHRNRERQKLLRERRRKLNLKKSAIKTKFAS